MRGDRAIAEAVKVVIVRRLRAEHPELALFAAEVARLRADRAGTERPDGATVGRESGGRNDAGQVHGVVQRADSLHPGREVRPDHVLEVGVVFGADVQGPRHPQQPKRGFPFVRGLDARVEQQPRRRPVVRPLLLAEVVQSAALGVVRLLEVAERHGRSIPEDARNNGRRQKGAGRHGQGAGQVGLPPRPSREPSERANGTDADGSAGQPVLQVLCQGGGGSVAPARLLLQAAEADCFQVAAQARVGLAWGDRHLIHDLEERVDRPAMMPPKVEMGRPERPAAGPR